MPGSEPESPVPLKLFRHAQNSTRQRSYAAAIGRAGDQFVVWIGPYPARSNRLLAFAGLVWARTTSRPSSALAAGFGHELLQTLIGNLSRDQVAFGVHCQGVYVLELAGVGTFPSD